MIKFYSFIAFISSALCFSQYNDNLSYGLKVAALHSTTTHIPEMLIGREHNLTNFQMKTKGVYSVEGGFFVNYKFSNTRTAIQPELIYRKGGEKLHYHNSQSGQEYDIDFKYSYLILGSIYKIYPYEGLNFGIGVHYAKNLTPHNIEYSSNEFDGRHDTNYRQFYRDGIIGKDDFNLSFNVGYELANDFHFDLRYYLGIGDAIGTRSTSFQFTENTNRNSFLALSLGYSFHNW